MRPGRQGLRISRRRRLGRGTSGAVTKEDEDLAVGSDWTHGFDPDDPITLREAATIFLRGLVTESTLRVAISRGELGSERLGRRIVTTPEMLREWRRRNSSSHRP